MAKKSFFQAMKNLRKRGKKLGSVTTDRKKNIDNAVKKNTRGSVKKGYKKA